MYSPRSAQLLRSGRCAGPRRDRSVVEGMPVAESLAIAQEEMDKIMAESQYNGLWSG